MEKRPPDADPLPLHTGPAHVESLSGSDPGPGPPIDGRTVSVVTVTGPARQSAARQFVSLHGDDLDRELRWSFPRAVTAPVL